jgi:hypothetical protein
MSETRELTAAVRHAFIVDEWKPMHRATLRGFCKVTMPSGMILADVSVHLDSGKSWAMPASKPMIGRDGNVLRDQAGKVRYSPIVSFASKELRDRFSVAVIDALLATYPDALG